MKHIITLCIGIIAGAYSLWAGDLIERDCEINATNTIEIAHFRVSDSPFPYYYRLSDNTIACCIHGVAVDSEGEPVDVPLDSDQAVVRKDSIDPCRLIVIATLTQVKAAHNNEWGGATNTLLVSEIHTAEYRAWGDIAAYLVQNNVRQNE